MSGEHPTSFVDTNVLVYAFEIGDSHKKKVAQDLLTRLMENEQLRLSTQVLQEFLVTVTRKASRPCSTEAALAVLDDLAAWPVTTVNYGAIRAAASLADQVKVSFWDALVVVAAVQAGAGVLYTEDLNHGQSILGVRVENPFRV